MTTTANNTLDLYVIGGYSHLENCIKKGLQPNSLLTKLDSRDTKSKQMSSTSSKKRPAPLNLAGTKCVPGTLQTPKHLAQDITMQCLSPTLPRGITPEMLKRTQEIEAQQRQIIVQRGLCAYDRGDGDDDDIKSQNSTPTSANTSSSSSVPGIMVEGEAIPPHRAAHSVPASATSASYSRRPWELGKESSTATATTGSGSTAPSSNISVSTPTTLQERRGAKPVSLDVNALKREDDPESKALDEEDEVPTLPSMHQYMQGLNMGKKRKFMELCSEMWDLLHS